MVKTSEKIIASMTPLARLLYKMGGIRFLYDEQPDFIIRLLHPFGLLFAVWGTLMIPFLMLAEGGSENIFNEEMHWWRDFRVW